MVREPAVAGRFYTGDPDALARQVDALVATSAAKAPAIGVVAPHAGYVYSGAIAGAVYGRVVVPDRVLVLGPNHTGLGADGALWVGSAWRTPLGEVPIDQELADALLEDGRVTADRAAHRLEHSLEVQVPFLQRMRPDVRIAALCLGHLALDACLELGRTVARTARATGALVVASSDMSHYVSADVARERDGLAIARILALDPEGLYEVVHRERITMCGIIPTTVMLAAARELGARRAELVRYGSSGDVSGDLEQVVGYASVIVA